MQPATAWGEVLRVLGTRQRLARAEADAARRRLAESAGRLHLMSAVVAEREYRDEIKASWRGGPAVLAFLFAQPDSEAIASLDRRREYFDHRTGDTWTLFFPGYATTSRDPALAQRPDVVPVGRDQLSGWYYDAGAFNHLRQTVERSSQGRWEYSGGVDLVLVNGWMPERGPVSIDWVSTISGQVTDAGTGTRTLSLPEVIERISRDLEQALEGPDYGVGTVTGGPVPDDGRGGMARDVLANALGGVVAALATSAVGLQGGS